MDQVLEYLSNVNIAAVAVDIGIRLTLVLLIYIVGRWLARLSQRILEKMLRKRDVDAVLVDFLGSVVNIAVTVVAVIAALDQLGISPAPYSYHTHSYCLYLYIMVQ